jgi:ABC-type transporter Mla subunit MlaD
MIQYIVKQLQSRKLVMAAIVLLCGSSAAGGLLASASAQSDQPAVTIQNATALLVAISSVVGAIAGIAISIVNVIKSKNGDATNYDAILKIAESLEQTDEWIQQNQEKIRKLVEALERLSKQNADTLTENSLSSKALAREIGEDERDLKKIYPIVPKENPFR